MWRFGSLASVGSVSTALLIACADQAVEPSLPAAGQVAAASRAPALAAPGDAVATGVSETAIDVGWTDNSSNETRVEVHRSTTGAGGTFTLLATLAADVTRYSDRTLEPGTVFCYKVRAMRVSGGKTVASDFSNTACAVAPPAAPSNASAVGATYPKVALSWQDNASLETEFLVLRSVDGENGTFVDSYWASANAVSITDLAVVTGTRYCYRIEAVRQYPTAIPPYHDFVYSSPSNTTCATPPPPSVPPPAAYQVSARAAASTVVTVTAKWTDTTMPAPAFRSYRSMDGGATWSLVTLTGGNDGNYSDSPLASEQQVCYRVVAYNVAGDAAPSNQACATPPAAPTNLIGTFIDSSTVELRWTDNSAIEDGYEVWARWYRGTFYCYPPGTVARDAGTYEGEGQVASLGPNVTTFRVQVDHCDPATEYWFTVVAKKDGGSSTGTNEVGVAGTGFLP